MRIFSRPCLAAGRDVRIVPLGRPPPTRSNARIAIVDVSSDFETVVVVVFKVMDALGDPLPKREGPTRVPSVAPLPPPDSRRGSRSRRGHADRHPSPTRAGSRVGPRLRAGCARTRGVPPPHPGRLPTRWRPFVGRFGLGFERADQSTTTWVSKSGTPCAVRGRFPPTPPALAPSPSRRPASPRAR